MPSPKRLLHTLKVEDDWLLGLSRYSLCSLIDLEVQNWIFHYSLLLTHLRIEFFCSGKIGCQKYRRHKAFLSPYLLYGEGLKLPLLPLKVHTNAKAQNESVSFSLQNVGLLVSPKSHIASLVYFIVSKICSNRQSNCRVQITKLATGCVMLKTHSAVRCSYF